MGTISKVLVTAKYAAATQTTQYTAPAGTRAIIDKATVTNAGASNATLSVNLVANGESAAANNLVVDARTIAVGEAYTLPALIGHSLEAGDFISTIASAADTLVIRVSGREIT